jgi:hypothetical protein
MTGATGDVTVTGSNATTVNATAGAHSITGGTGADTITVTGTGTSAQTIAGGLGADLITFSGTSSTGGAVHVIQIAAVNDTGTVIGQAVSTAVTAAFNTSGMDKVTGFGTGATITLAPGGAITTATTLTRNGVALGADNAGSVALIVGTYSASGNTFTPSAAGSDSALIFDVDGTTAGAPGYRAVVLVGYVDLNANDTISAAGLFSSVA